MQIILIVTVPRAPRPIKNINIATANHCHISQMKTMGDDNPQRVSQQPRPVSIKCKYCVSICLYTVQLYLYFVFISSTKLYIDLISCINVCLSVLVKYRINMYQVLKWDRIACISCRLLSIMNNESMRKVEKMGSYKNINLFNEW